MATYYVKPTAQGGNNSLAGTSPSTAWATIAYALTSSSGFASGDTLYIAPGVYTDAITVTMPNPTVETNIIGDPTVAQFSGLTPGPVVITNHNSTLAGTGYSGNLLSATTKNFLHFQNIKFAYGNSSAISFGTCTNLKLTRCSFIASKRQTDIIRLTSPTSTAVNFTISKCVFSGGTQGLYITGQGVADGSTVTDTLFIGQSNTSMFLENVQVAIYNCVICASFYGMLQQPGSLTFPTTVRNSLFFQNTQDMNSVGTANTIIENFNRLLSPTARTNVADNGTSSVTGDIGIDFFETLLWGQNNLQPFTSYASSPNANFGNSTGAPATDIYGVLWTGTKPDAGAGTYRVITNVPVNIGYVANLPVNTQATTIAIFSGSTSQSIEVYLGATGLTSSTVGLSATYNKNRTADVVMPLVTRTIAQPWIAGGFAEVNQTTMPGVYRLDIPNEAISAGYGNTTIVIRGASGTNGAVVTIQEPPPIGTQLRMGPFTVQADGILTDDRLKLIQGSVHSIDFKMVDAYGTGVDGTGTVVTAKVYNAAGFLIDTYTCTAMYALDGRYSFAIDSTVTDNVGMYTINIYRQIGTETNVFGRMKLEVLSP
jgi:uncharacterized protein YebE (UPF0316 family)